MSDVHKQSTSNTILPSLVTPQERHWGKDTLLNQLIHKTGGVLRRVGRPNYDRNIKKMLIEMRGFYAETLLLDDEDLRRKVIYVGSVLRKSGLSDRANFAHLFALLCEISTRVLGLTPHDVQIIGAKVLLDGRLAEMATGEGKTLVAGLAAAASALVGTSVHVVTVNDYLAIRDANTVMPLMAFLGISVGVVVKDTPPEERASQYACPICYCTNKELSFDYLRDSSASINKGYRAPLSSGQFEHSSQNSRRLNGLVFAIVDEADSILVDEARTPLILSEGVGSAISEEIIERVMIYVEQLKEGQDFDLNRLNGNIVLKDTCLDKLARNFSDVAEGPLYLDALREELVTQALMARHMYKLNEHYLVRHAKVQIIDEYTGRVFEDRVWSAGLHQMIEFKEQCPLTEPRETIARITYQRLFRRYKKLSGMTGTAAEVKGEFWNVFGLEVYAIPTNRPSLRKVLVDRVYVNKQEKWKALIKQVKSIHENGAPILIGSRTVLGSEEICKELAEAGLTFDVLHAANDSQEADVVAGAGQLNNITVATNMAGRGTDISLGVGVEEVGGLHVIMTDRHDAGRIDRQLMGRCARQGDPGTFLAMVSLEDALAMLVRPRWLIKFAASLMRWDRGRLANKMLQWGQRKLEKEHSQVRERLLKSDQSEGDLLAFSGRPE